MPGEEHAVSTLDRRFAGGQQNRACPTTVVSATTKEMHRALDISVGTSEYISILEACVPMITAHVPFSTDPYNFQFAQLSAFFTHHQTTHDGNDLSPPRIAAAVARLVPSMAPLLDAIDSAIDRDAKLVAKERLCARTALEHKTEAEIQAEPHHKALTAAIASNTHKRPSPDGVACPAPEKRGAAFSPGVQGLVDVFRSRKPGLTTDEAKELAKKLLSGRCTSCALTRKGCGSHASCPATDCLRDKTPLLFAPGRGQGFAPPVCSHVPLHAPPPPASILNATLSPLLHNEPWHPPRPPVPRPTRLCPAVANSSTIPAMPGSVHACTIQAMPGGVSCPFRLCPAAAPCPSRLCPAAANPCTTPAMPGSASCPFRLCPTAANPRTIPATPGSVL